jgi:hypothetical protein
MSSSVNKLAQLAAAAAAKAELEETHDYEAFDDSRKMIEAAKGVLHAKQAKQALKEGDLKKCTELWQATLQVLRKRRAAWRERLEEMKKLAPQVKTDQHAAAEWAKIKSKADVSRQKYIKLEEELKSLHKDLGAELISQWNCSAILLEVSFLKDEVAEVEKLSQ